jgi:predicted dehydrogenase
MDGVVRFGFWGAGRVAHDVATDLALVAGAKAVAVASRSAASAQALAGRHGIARHGAGLDVLLRDREVDVIYIATPAHCHAADALACIGAGKGVLCEKPFALDAGQAQQVIDAARQARVFCMEAMWTRFVPAVVEARRLVASNALGAIRWLSGSFGYPVDEASHASLFDARQGGGALLDRGVYLISLAQHLLGEPTSAAATARVGRNGADEDVDVQLGFHGGARADLWASLRALAGNDFTLCGERGSLRLRDPFYRSHALELKHALPATAGGAGGGLKAALRGNATLQGLRRRWRGAGPVRRFAFPGNGYQFELAEVVRCLRAQRFESPTMPWADTLSVMRTLDRLQAGA